MAPQGDISMTEERLLVDWKTLKKLGWPYSRQHTYRLIAAEKFPQPKKFGDHPGARVAWRWHEVKPYLE
jgi:predicted DNA-binding transcriptional regulator AlpA